LQIFNHAFSITLECILIDIYIIAKVEVMNYAALFLLCWHITTLFACISKPALKHQRKIVR